MMGIVILHDTPSSGEAPRPSSAPLNEMFLRAQESLSLRDADCTGRWNQLFRWSPWPPEVQRGPWFPRDETWKETWKEMMAEREKSRDFLEMVKMKLLS